MDAVYSHRKTAAPGFFTVGKGGACSSRSHRNPEQRAARIKLEVQAEMDRTNRRNAYRIMNHDQQWRSEERNA